MPNLPGGSRIPRQPGTYNQPSPWLQHPKRLGKKPRLIWHMLGTLNRISPIKTFIRKPVHQPIRQQKPGPRPRPRLRQLRLGNRHPRDIHPIPLRQKPRASPIPAPDIHHPLSRHQPQLPRHQQNQSLNRRLHTLPPGLKVPMMHMLPPHIPVKRIQPIIMRRHRRARLHRLRQYQAAACNFCPTAAKNPSTSASVWFHAVTSRTTLP